MSFNKLLLRMIVPFSLCLAVLGTCLFYYLDLFQFISPLYLCLISLSFGLIVFLNNPRNLINGIFLALTFFICLWAIFVVLIWFYQEEKMATFFVRFSYSSGLIILFILNLFAEIIINKMRKKNRF